MTTQHDTPDNGTPGISDAQAAALYAFVRKHLTPQLIEAAQNAHHLTYGLEMWMQTTNGDIVDMAALLSEITSAHEGGNAEGGKRYVVVYEPQSYDGVLHDARFHVFDTDTHKNIDTCGHMMHHEAQAAADNLNTGDE
jgi:hypothetical protein